MEVAENQLRRGVSCGFMILEALIDEVCERVFPIVLLLFASTHLLGVFLFPIGPKRLESSYSACTDLYKLS